MVAGEAGKLPASRVVLEGSIDDFSAFTPDVEPEEEGNNHSSSHDSSADSSLTGKVSLQEENELLKADVVLLKKEVARLRATSRQPPKSPPKKQALLPPSLRQAAGDNRRRRPHRKLSGVALNDNDMEAVRAEPDLEMHESGRGLHQRRSHHNKTPSPVVGADSILSRFFADADTSQLIEDDEEEEGGLELACLVGDASDNTGGDCEVLIEPASEMTEPSFREQVQDRALWLVGLLVLQSMSSFIIARNESLLQHHVIIVRFLTMLVGAGGNAGNQASVRVIRGLAIGTVNDHNYRSFLKNEFKIAWTLACILGVAGCVRAAVFLTPVVETLAITTSLFFIVLISIVLGALLPLGMKQVGIDPAHSSTSIQVVMDILGVTITVQVCGAILDSAFQNWVVGL